MDKSKRERLEAKGWKVGTVAEFLELTPEEAALVEIKLALSRSLKERRQNLMTQADLAAKLHSSQPRIANAENGDASVSIELLIRAMLATGATPQDIGKVIASIRE
ncbi:MAG: helix-turn-helix transcriptional regulator [Dolichospermum sp. DET50]|nr:helix-turn-helix transcriptional regulator [Dolichospermum sp. DET66]MBS3034733.1 helix-turn-helix transcriptional regulator [Dolichospermum sp. DET67]MBS3039936.1 helix-turn-helix transcriptional regulator [Dolichospermum sp. DET50]QSX67123.1 MAG: helix-turn-helix transcriptional regulator [Dolichospermum sp. DET69]